MADISNNMIDIHSHIIWDIDDGADSTDMSLAMAAIALSEGIKKIVATPHCIEEESLDIFAQEVKYKCNLLQRKLSENNMPIELISGAEVYIEPSMLEKPGLTKLSIGKTPYILVELPMGEVPAYAEDFLYRLQLKGLIPIIAHPERNRKIVENPNILKRLIELGSLSQINTGSITGLFGSRIQENAKILLTHNMGHMLGTDAHSNGRRGPYIKDATKNLYKWLDKDKANEIIVKNARRVIRGALISVESPIEYKRRIGFLSKFLRD